MGGNAAGWLGRIVGALLSPPIGDARPVNLGGCTANARHMRHPAGPVEARGKRRRRPASPASDFTEAGTPCVRPEATATERATWSARRARNDGERSCYRRRECAWLPRVASRSMRAGRVSAPRRSQDLQGRPGDPARRHLSRPTEAHSRAGGSDGPARRARLWNPLQPPSPS